MAPAFPLNIECTKRQKVSRTKGHKEVQDYNPTATWRVWIVDTSCHEQFRIRRSRAFSQPLSARVDHSTIVLLLLVQATSSLISVWPSRSTSALVLSTETCSAAEPPKDTAIVRVKL